MAVGELADAERHVDGKCLVDVAAHIVFSSRIILIHVDGEHEVLHRVSIEDCRTIRSNDTRILSISGTIHHNRVLDTGIAQVFHCLHIAFLPGGGTGFPLCHPFVGDIDDYRTLMTDDCILDADPVLHRLVQVADIVAAQWVMYTEHTDHLVILAQLDECFYFRFGAITKFLAVTYIKTQCIATDTLGCRNHAVLIAFLPGIRVVAAAHDELVALGIDELGALDVE